MRIPDEHAAGMARDYRAGLTFAELERKWGWSITACRRAVKRQGVKARPAARREVERLKASRTCAEVRERWAQWAREYALGGSIYSIADAHGVTFAAIRYALVQMGVPRRRPGSAPSFDAAAAVELKARGLTSRAVAEALGTSPGAVRSAWFRARRAEARA